MKLLIFNDVVRDWLWTTDFECQFKICTVIFCLFLFYLSICHFVSTTSIHYRPLLIFVFSTQFEHSWRSLKFAIDWIWTADLWCWKRPLYQLSHNHFIFHYIYLLLFSFKIFYHFILSPPHMPSFLLHHVLSPTSSFSHFIYIHHTYVVQFETSQAETTP